ncbi:hypothetical protein HK101_001278 [Irineochytrium annulatum]|nr:hypothetical protein HK101_001278 [Irineochytrium annulatum]
MNPEVYPVNTSDRAYNDEVNGDVIGPNEVPGDTLNTLAFLGLGTPPADDWMTNNIPKLNGGKAHLLEGDFGGYVSVSERECLLICM